MPAEFVFINEDAPLAGQSTHNKRRVRAQAARGPHTNSSNHGTVVSTTLSISATHTVTTKALPNRRNSQRVGSAKAIAFSDDSIQDLRQRNGTEDKKKSTIVVTVEEKPLEAEIDFNSTPAQTTNSSNSNPETAIVQQPEAPKQPAANQLAVVAPSTRMNVGMFAQGPPPSTSLFFSHYITNMAVAIPELDLETPEILRKRWVPWVCQFPAVMSVILLTSAHHYAIVSGQDAVRTAQIVTLKSRTHGYLIKLLQEVPNDARLSDILIGCVAKLASYEASFGRDLAAFTTHMNFLEMLVKKRGGLSKLGLGGLLERMILWIDINSAFQLGTEVRFWAPLPLAGHTSPVWMFANPKGFLGYET